MQAISKVMGLLITCRRRLYLILKEYSSDLVLHVHKGEIDGYRNRGQDILILVHYWSSSKIIGSSVFYDASVFQ